MEFCRNQDDIDYVQNDYHKKNKFGFKRREMKKKCFHCNNIYKTKKCKTYRTKCANCKITGHWAVCCRFKKVNEVRIEQNNYHEYEEFTFLGKVSNSTEDNYPWILMLE